MLEAVDKMIIKCNTCGHEYSIIPEMEYIDAADRNMGTEYELESIWEINCKKCGTDLYMRLEAWEYPEGVLNDTKYDGENITILKKPKLECR